MKKAHRILNLVFGFALIVSSCAPRTQFQLPELSLICQGVGSDSAASLNWQILHSIVVASENGENHKWNGQIPDEWYPASLSQLQLVACIGKEEEEVIEVCPYSGGPSITRYRYRVFVWLVEARSGTAVDSRSFYGPEPRRCKESEEVSLTEIWGQHVRFDETREWLARYVEMPELGIDPTNAQQLANELTAIASVDTFDSIEQLAGWIKTWGAATDAVCGLDNRTGEARSGGGALHILWPAETSNLASCARGPKAAFDGETWRTSKGISFWIRTNFAGSQIKFWVDSGYSGQVYPVQFTTPEMSTEQWVKVSFLWEQFQPAESSTGEVNYPFDPSFVNMYGFEISLSQLGQGIEIWIDDVELLGD